MAGKFSDEEVQALLARCHRRCCICHQFCGVKMETDHMDPKGGDTIENAIPVCFNCHAEIHSYDDEHPRGRKFHPAELRKHKEQWLSICETDPSALITPGRGAGVGPLQALIDELDFNLMTTALHKTEDVGALFLQEQFLAAVAAGAVSILTPSLKTPILDAYVAMARANELTKAAFHHAKGSNAWNEGVDFAAAAVGYAAGRIAVARDALLRFLGPE